MSEMKKLSDIAELTVGYVGTMGKEYSEQGIKFLRSLNIKPFSFDLSDIKYIPTEFNEKIKKSELHIDDVVIVRTGIPGTCAVIPKDLNGCNCADLVIVHPNKDVVNPYYLCAFINSWGKAQVSNVKVGAVQKHFNVTSAEEMLVPLVNIREQNNIASFIYNINIKIANNQEITTILEQQAKLLYDYWFVQFDFPDENGKPYKSSGGKMVWNEELKREIPEGWEIKRFIDICDIVLGGTPKTEYSEYWDGDISWLNSGEVAQFPVVTSELKITELGLNNSATVLMPKGTVIVSITGNLRVSILAIDTCGNQSIVGILENSEYKKEYLYPILKDLLWYYNRIATGNCQQHISKGTIENTLIVCPPNDIMKSYYKKTESIYSVIIKNGLENQQLASLRDFLLPMLMNGQVKVKGIKDE